MSLEINTNIAAMDAANNLSRTERSMSQSIQRPSSGLRINSAADDAAGLAISENLQGQINGGDQASRNAQDGVSFVQTADGALGEVQQMLQRIRELAVQYANSTLNSSDQTAIHSEVSQLISGIEQIGSTAQFNGINLLNSAATISFQVGANDGDVISTATVSLAELLSPILGGGQGQQGGLPWELVGPHGEVVQGVGMYDPHTNPVGQDLYSNGGFLMDTQPKTAGHSAEEFPAYSGEDAGTYNNGFSESLNVVPGSSFAVDIDLDVQRSAVARGEPARALSRCDFVVKSTSLGLETHGVSAFSRLAFET